MRCRRRRAFGVGVAVGLTACLCVALLVAQPSAPSSPPAPAASIAIQANRPGPAMPPTLFGVFFADINFAADGGLYPELVKDRSFEFTEPLKEWSKGF